MSLCTGGAGQWARGGVRGRQRLRWRPKFRHLVGPGWGLEGGADGPACGRVTSFQRPMESAKDETCRPSVRAGQESRADGGRARWSARRHISAVWAFRVWSRGRGVACGSPVLHFSSWADLHVPCLLGHSTPPLVPPHPVQVSGTCTTAGRSTTSLRLAPRRLSAWGAFFNETFSITPDFPGVSRALRHTLSPVFAHDRHRGAEQGRPGYRWMLLGDDDTGGLRVKATRVGRVWCAADSCAHYCAGGAFCGCQATHYIDGAVAATWEKVIPCGADAMAVNALAPVTVQPYALRLTALPLIQPPTANYLCHDPQTGPSACSVEQHPRRAAYAEQPCAAVRGPNRNQRLPDRLRLPTWLPEAAARARQPRPHVPSMRGGRPRAGGGGRGGAGGGRGTGGVAGEKGKGRAAGDRGRARVPLPPGRTQRDAGRVRHRRGSELLRRCRWDSWMR